jgi:hypothetical protein
MSEQEGLPLAPELRKAAPGKGGPVSQVYQNPFVHKPNRDFSQCNGAHEGTAAPSAPKTEGESEEYVLSILRHVSRLLTVIKGEVEHIGVSLSQRRVTWKQAISLVEQTAPGCYPAVWLSILDGTHKDGGEG